MTMPDESIGVAAGLVPSETLHRGETIVTAPLLALDTLRFRLSVPYIAAKRLSPRTVLDRSRNLTTFQSPTSRGNDCHVRHDPDQPAAAGVQLSVPYIAGKRLSPGR